MVSVVNCVGCYFCWNKTGSGRLSYNHFTTTPIRALTTRSAKLSHPPAVLQGLQGKERIYPSERVGLGHGLKQHPTTAHTMLPCGCGCSQIVSCLKACISPAFSTNKKGAAAARPNSRVTPRAVPFPLAPRVAHADHVQLLRLEEGQQAVAQADLPHVRHRVCVALHQSTSQAGLHVSC